LRKRVLASTATAAVAAACGLVLPLAGPAATAAAAPAHAVPGDFDGDGHPDLVVATPHATVNGKAQAGSVTVLYGSASGPSTSRSATITQSTAGVPGTPEAYDQFGAAYATGDLDGDGYTDLAVGVPAEVSSGPDYGIVQILWGGPRGLVHGALTVYGAADGNSRYLYGSGLAVGDFDGDGRAQLAVTGYAGVSVFGDRFTRTAAPARAEETTGAYGSTRGTGSIVAGDFDCDGADDLVVSGENDTDDDDDPGVWLGYYAGGPGGMTYTEDPATVPLTAAYARAAADIDHDGCADLVTYGKGATGAGTIAVHYGGRGGIPAATRATVVDQDTPGVPGVGEPGDAFGASVSAGDVDGDGYPDLAVGAPGEDVGAVTDAGAVWLLKGSAQGLTTVAAQSFTQDTAGVPGVAEAYDRFGRATRLRDVTGDGRADLTAAAPGEDVFAGESRWNDGADWVLRGGAAGLTTSGALSFSEKAFGLTYQNKEFGSVLGG
jgi:FG-GAP repeat/FG-GAP-like repeat